MNFFKIFSSFFQKKYPTGLIPDPRTEDEKSLDYLHEEIAMASVPKYKTGSFDLVHYPEENQNHTFSCVAHGSTLAQTKGNPRLSKMFFYRNRSNYPGEGMWLQDAGNIAKNIGSCLYQTLPNFQTEDVANNIPISDAAKVEATEHRADKYVQIQNLNIDTIAAAVNNQPVAILIYASYGEWSKQYPTSDEGTTLSLAPIRHCVTAVDAFIENGVKYLKIQDSAWFGGINVRYVSEKFIKDRCYGAMYFTTLVPAPSPKPDYVFHMDLRLRYQGPEVKILQERLMYEGTFPANQTATGYFGGITLKAVKDYQAKHGIPVTGFCGPITRAHLNI